MILIYLITGLLLMYLIFCVGYISLLSVAGKLYQRKTNTTIPISAADVYRRIAILVPAYREDAVILSSVLSYENIRYPSDRFDVYVIADQLQPETIAGLRNTRARIILVHFEQSSKAKAINMAFQTITNDYDIALICDADNVLHPDFLTFVNMAFADGKLALQGQRVAKNLDTPFAILDASSEMINNHLFRMGNRALGLSSAVIGSGMAFDYHLLKNIFLQIDSLGGFDKQLQLLLTRHRIKIFYEPRAIVFDEKVMHASQFSRQRKRWLFSHIHFFKKHIKSAISELLRGNFDYFNLAVLQALIPPRLFLGAFILILTLFSGLISLFYPTFQSIWIYFVFIEFIYFISLFISIPFRFLRNYLFPSLAYIPHIFSSMFVALLNAGEAKNNFLHTVHIQHKINNPLYEYK